MHPEFSRSIPTPHGTVDIELVSVGKDFQVHARIHRVNVATRNILIGIVASNYFYHDDVGMRKFEDETGIARYSIDNTVITMLEGR